MSVRNMVHLRGLEIDAFVHTHSAIVRQDEE
jgi:hypothetical protein